MELRPRLSRDSTLKATRRGWLLSIAAGTKKNYRLSQLDDQAGRPRSEYPWYPPLAVTLRARASGRAAAGTWGFGLWNDPYGFSFGPGERFLRLPAMPQAAWFFSASSKCYLSLTDDKPARGFYAQVFSSPGFRPPVISATLLLPFAPRTARRLLSQVIQEEAVDVKVDPEDWHSYRIEWTAAGVQFQTGGTPILTTRLSPRAPLGFVIWIDNQYAAFDPQGKLRWGVEANQTELWLEVKDIEITSKPKESG